VSLQNYADRIVNYLHDQGYTYAVPDARGGRFKGGILMDVGAGERVAFLLPTDNYEVPLRSLRGYLDDLYPGRDWVVDPPDHGGGVTTVKVTAPSLAASGAS
jgi:hypothetical protein